MSQPERRDLGDGSGRTVLPDGSMVGGYRVRFLAAGGMSVVYLGEKLGKQVVLKEVASTNTRDAPFLIQEKMLLERLKHPGLITFYSFLSTQAYYYLVVEYVEGEPLSSYLNSEQIAAVEDVADWAVQLCDIFEYLHQQKPPIIYRDLKPENVILTGDRVKLIDFGIARLHKGGTRDKDTQLMGSRSTASPEHFGASETDARSDIFTLGATLYELLTGGRRQPQGPFEFAPIRELRPDVPAALEAVLTKALQLKPAERYSSARELGDAILQAVGRPPRPKVEASAQQPEPRAKKRRSPLKVAVVAAMLAGAVGFGLTRVELLTNPASEFPPSTGVQEASLKGDLFAAGKMKDGPVVFLGEDIGLFQVSSWKEGTALERADTIATRLNRFYKTACLGCGGSNLEPPDIRVGLDEATGEIVVFYAHIHGTDPPVHGPLLLTTVDADQARLLSKPAADVAYYWRDLMRDTLALSRGFPVQNSALGKELSGALARARGQLKPQGDTVENLREILRQTTGKEALKMRETFLQVPARQNLPDLFQMVMGYRPLPGP